MKTKFFENIENQNYHFCKISKTIVQFLGKYKNLPLTIQGIFIILYLGLFIFSILWGHTQGVIIYLKQFIGVAKTLWEHCEASDSTPCLRNKHPSQLYSHQLSSQNNCRRSNKCLRAPVSTRIGNVQCIAICSQRIRNTRMYKIYKIY